MPITPVEVSPTERSLMIVPPVLGWNTKDPLSEMDPRYSPGIENFFPGNGAVSLRNGYTQHVKTASGNGYYHLDELVDSAGTHFLIGLTFNGTPYNVSSAGAGTAITGGFATQYFENYSVNYMGRLFFKAYTDAANSDMLSTDGTAATRPAFTGPGGDDKDLWRLTTYKGRIYALEISGASMWYPETRGAITGALTEYDFQSLFTLGGKPWYIGPFSMTNGDSTQEYFCVISEMGEVILFQGDSPSDTTWYQVSHFYIPAPAGRQSFFKWRSDILVITYDGLLSLREYIGTQAGEDYKYLSDNIATDFKDYITATIASGFGNMIQGIVYPKGQYLLVSFNDTTLDLTPTQFVMNTQTRAWTKFTGQFSYCWSLFNNGLYWGSNAASNNSYVALADNGYKDVDRNDSAITLTRTIKCRHAFNYFGNPTQDKVFTKVQPIMYQSEGMSITCNMDVDFSNTTATATEGPDTSKGTSYQLYNPEIAVTNDTSYYGTAGSFRIDGTVTEKRFRLEATKVTWTEG
jgi:hypothetical protein